MSKPINENPNPAPRCNAPHIQIHPTSTVAELRAALAEAEAERDALKARAERAEAAWGRLAILFGAIHERDRLMPHGSPEQCVAASAQMDAARAAVDAHGDLEVPK